MAPPSSPPVSAARDRPRIRESAWLFLPVFGSTILWVAVAAGVEAASGFVTAELDPRLAGSVTYAVVVAASLVAVHAVIHRPRDVDARLDRVELLQVGGIAVLVSLVAAYWLVGTSALPAFPGDLVAALLAGPIGMGAIALGFAEARGLDLRTALPGRGVAPHAVVALLGAAAIGVGWHVALAIVDAPFTPFPTAAAFAPRLRAADLLWRLVGPGLLSGVGWRFLYNGAIQEGLRRNLGPTGGVAAVTALIGALSVTFGALLRTTGPVVTVGTAAGVVVLSLLAAFLAARLAGLLARWMGRDVAPAVAGAIGVLVVSLPLVLVAAAIRHPPVLLPAGLASTTVAAVACVSYERSRSAWIPSVAYATYFVVADVPLAQYAIGAFT